MNRFSIRRLLQLALLFLLVMGGCDRAPSDPLLPPTGELITPAIGTISGIVRLDTNPARLPYIRVYALRDVDTTCVSAYTTIQVVGNYTDPAFSTAETPVMQRLLGCVWVDSIYLTPGSFSETPDVLQWKFVTNRSFDNPPDYGSPGTQIDGLEGATVLNAPGPDGNLQATVTQAGAYLAALDERRLRYVILPYDQAPIGTVDQSSGEFSVDLLRDGVYTLVFQGEDIVTRRVPGVAIVGGVAVDVGTVDVDAATIAITGRVGFEGNPDPAPTAVVTLLAGATNDILGEQETSDAFSFSGLADGNYRLRLRAEGFRDSTQAVTYAGTTVDVGTITLRAGCSSTFNTIQVAGDLNPDLYGNFDLALSPQMTRDGCVWEATLSGVTAGNHYFKFVTDGAFDNPPDYGGSELCTPELSGAVVPVTGQGTALCVTFAEDGDYVFRLDEETRTFSITKPGGSGPTGRLKGRVAYADDPSKPVEARVELFRAGTNLRVDYLDTGEAFSFAGVPVGDYDVKVSSAGYLAVTVAATVRQGLTTDVGTITLEPGCVSAFNRIQVAGNLNVDLYGNFDLARSPDMTNLGDCVWEAVVNNVTTGDHYFKFVTNNAFDSPPDYGSDEVCRPDLGGPVEPVSGQGTAICVTFAEAGNYRFTLDEKTQSFTIEKIVVAMPATIRGSVSFAGTPAPGLKAFVQLYRTGGPAPILVDSDSTGSAYEFTGLEAGDFELRFSAVGYLPATKAASAASGQVVDVGDTQLQPGFSSRFSTIAVIGDFPGINWEPNAAPAMTQVSPGTWKVTVNGITGGNHYFKFRTNGNWETPDPDYGSNFDETCRANLSGSVTLVGTGGPSALCVIFPAGTAAYDFTLDEQALTYTIVRQGTAGSGSIAGSVTFAGIAQAPYPVATVRLQAQAGSTDLGTAPTDPATGAFSFTQLDPGSYKLIITAGCFQPVTLENIAVTTTAVNLPAVNLASAPSQFSLIQLVGTFNGFDLGSTAPMTQVSNCVWADTVSITDAGPAVEFKFVTGGSYDTPPDYGVPGDQVDPAAGPCVLGAGGSSGNIKVQLAESGTYRFELNEIYRTYSVTRIGSANMGARPR